MKVYEYKDYDDYVENQTILNKRKIKWTYVENRVIQTIVKNKGPAENIICHGTRNGKEQKLFKNNYPDAYIIGTEISETAEDFPMTVQHDFTFQKEEWVGKFDILYSNSLDHSIDPHKTIETWRDQLSSTGRMYVEFYDELSFVSPGDPLEATNEEIKELLKTSGLNILGDFPGKRRGIVFICERKPE